MGRYKDEQMRQRDPNYGRSRGENRKEQEKSKSAEPTATEITDALGGTWDARRSEGLACCPAHDDGNPSLVIFDRDDLGGDGRARFHCRAHCDWKDIIAALQKLGLWPEWFGGGTQFACEYIYNGVSP